MVDWFWFYNPCSNILQNMENLRKPSGEMSSYVEARNLLLRSNFILSLAKYILHFKFSNNLIYVSTFFLLKPLSIYSDWDSY